MMNRVLYRSCLSVFVMLCSIVPVLALEGDTGKALLPVTRIALFSSGVSFIEHSGSVTGPASFPLAFQRDAVNDVLKSLVIHDSESRNPSVTYDSEDTLARTLQSLSVNLSGNPGLSEILQSLQGNEVQVTVPDPLTGRIVSIEAAGGIAAFPDGKRPVMNRGSMNLMTTEGLRKISLSEISSITFTDPVIMQDFNRALDLLASARDDETRTLSVHLPGTGNRPVSLGYIVPSPVWKISYRLDLSQKKPVLQGWAIIDNTSDSDWENIELTLVSGRPVSFIQQLYPPYYLSRPEVPLAIAGAAAPEVYDSAMDSELMSDYAYEMAAAAPVPSMSYEKKAERSAAGFSTGQVETAAAARAGELFLFTLKNPVSIPRRQSAMVPLAEAAVTTKKVSVFSGENAFSGESHPMLCVELVNESNMRLPAGPVTVFDGASYAGDALLEFLPENDTRLLAYGEDLGVAGSLREETTRDVASVSVSRGVLTITRTQKKTTTYQFRNTTSESRSLVIEHPITPGTTLVEPKKPAEQTVGHYRFALDAAAGKTALYTVQEDRPVSETVSLLQQNTDTLLYYATSGAVPADIRKALEKAVEFRRGIADQESALSELNRERNEQIVEQERVRSNLHAVGNSSRQGQEYLKQLTELDVLLARLAADIATGREALQQQQKQYQRYLESLSFK
ncbi:MAG TPA: DUF4139 domain-containing protein [Treponemataceae bacterium]|nr:DUF4139 domain-containing protein [Treponemataceae bacterium]HOS34315.1 DUF4139 domain-containing protein [Treponemataceae bacterium]HPL90589.1 DUF4139 domain-containing protein [Treponemataceae bacterium]HRR02183.1 DUF4139 domain-containing protein [Treponemataceae bacterium]